MGKNLIDTVKAAGIIGAGGAGFPTHVKLNAKAEIVVVNGAECEPLLRVDQQLMASRSRDLLEAVSLIMELVGAKEGVVALKGKYHKAVDVLRFEQTNFQKIRIHEMENFYPAGDEQVTVYEATGRIVPEGGIPLNVGCIVVNVETALNIYDAYYHDIAVTDTYITVTGAVRRPVTVKVPVGITVAEAIELGGGTELSDFSVIAGGPMMGKIVKSLEEPVVKSSKGFIVLPSDHSLIRSVGKDLGNMLREAKTCCMHCNLCTEVCPRNLIGHNMHPSKLIRLASYNSACEEEGFVTTAYLCCECRLCEYACVMDLQPWKLHMALKKRLSASGIKNDNHAVPQQANPFRDYRRYPIPKLLSKLDLNQYDVPAPMVELRDIRKEDFGRVSIKLQQHIGAPSVARVSVGDPVEKGQLIAEIRENALGSNIYASISGTIEAISEEQIVIAKG